LAIPTPGQQHAMIRSTPRRLRPSFAVLSIAVSTAISIAVYIGPSTKALADPETAIEGESTSAHRSRPNILLIVADDLAYSDLGYYGSEIQTPNLNALAREGARLDTFYAAPACSPTRAMLLTGVDHHRAGLGTMAGHQTPDQADQPGYLGRLNSSVASLPAILASADYQTFMTGKWHLGDTHESRPSSRGFDRSFALMPGGAGAFANRIPLYGEEPAAYREDGRLLDALPADFYSTRVYTDTMISYLDERPASDQPFFAYLAYTAPHWPLQSPRQAILRQRGRYDRGYDQLRASRLQGLQERNVIARGIEPFPRLKSVAPWQKLSPEEQRYQARVMEIYASMVEELDHHLGRLLNYLRKNGLYENTLIVFLSDNGPEGNELDSFYHSIVDCCNNHLDNIGNADSYVWLGQGWAQATNPPFRMYKAFTGEGGIRVPALVHYPARIQPGQTIAEPLHVLDVLPTLLDAAGVSHPGASFDGRAIEEPIGHSLMPMLAGEAERTHDPEQVFAFELFGRRAIRQGSWKAVYLPFSEQRTAGLPEQVRTDRWQLFNIEADPAERNDLASEHPARLAQLLAQWSEYVETQGLTLSPDATPY
jgi:arylsulfatase A-like enzyme